MMTKFKLALYLNTESNNGRATGEPIVVEAKDYFDAIEKSGYIPLVKEKTDKDKRDSSRVSVWQGDKLGAFLMYYFNKNIKKYVLHEEINIEDL